MADSLPALSLSSTTSFHVDRLTERLATSSSFVIKRSVSFSSGMQYVVLEARLPHILLEELEPRVKETHCRHIEISPERLGQEATVAHAITNAGCQGKTCRQKLRICDVDNPYMTAKHLYVAISRATEEANVRIQ